MSPAEALAVLRRRARLLVGLPVLVALLSVATLRPAPPVYQARLAFAVDIPRSAIVVGSDEGTAAKIGEAIIDDFSRIVPGDVFAEAVAARLPPGTEISPGEIASSLSATDRHRIADVTVTRAAPAGADAAAIAALSLEMEAVAQAVVTELEENSAAWFARLGEDEVALTIVDRPDVTRVAPSVRERVELPLRVILALVVAIGLAFGLHALDPRLHDADEAASLVGAPVIGRIPRR